MAVEPTLRFGLLLALASLPLAVVLPGRIYSGLLLGAGISLVNFLGIVWMVRYRVVPRPPRRAGLLVGTVLLAKPLLLLALTVLVLYARWAHPMGIFLGLTVMLLALTFRSLGRLQEEKL